LEREKASNKAKNKPVHKVSWQRKEKRGVGWGRWGEMGDKSKYQTIFSIEIPKRGQKENREGGGKVVGLQGGRGSQPKNG